MVDKVEELLSLVAKKAMLGMKKGGRGRGIIHFATELPFNWIESINPRSYVQGI